MEKKDIGHDALVTDLAEMLNEAIAYEFHDFNNTRYAAPKMALREKLLALANQTINGKYDN